MIVMKFGGSSLESGEAIQRVVSIVKSELARKPVVVVSAMEKTTDRLIDFTYQSSRGHAYEAWKLLQAIQDTHYAATSRVTEGAIHDALEESLRREFLELHNLMVEIGEEGKELTPRLRDYILSFGERLSSRIVTAALQSSGVAAEHVDARHYILTDDKHGQATPLYWETYAQLRRDFSLRAQEPVLVLGGYIGATEAGVTTTLGRGGSDLTASIVGAGILADEIQIWTDVDGMLTCDPRVLPGGYRLRAISYGEAAAMAGAGAKVLHPDTVAPAMRQRIPIVIRNSRRPEVDGTWIRCEAGQAGVVKSIATKPSIALLQFQATRDAVVEAEALRLACSSRRIPVELLRKAGNRVYLGVASLSRYEDLQLDLSVCSEVRLRTTLAMISLVGEGIAHDLKTSQRAASVLKERCSLLLSDESDASLITILTPSDQMRACVQALHDEFFSAADPALFVESRLEVVRQHPDLRPVRAGSHPEKFRVPSTLSMERRLVP